MNNIWRIVLVIICVAGLLLVRFRESELFYDPLIRYFKGDFRHNSLPDLELSKLLLNMTYRYLMNFVLSMGILLAAFGDRGILRFAFYIYLIVFVVLGIAFVILLQVHEPLFYVPLFYVRRFLIQPLLILLLLPAFYYYKQQQA